MKRDLASAACALVCLLGCDADEERSAHGEGMAQVVVSIDASVTGVSKPVTGRYAGTPFAATLAISRFADEGGAIVGYGQLHQPTGALPAQALQALAAQPIRLPVFLLPHDGSTDAGVAVADAGLTGGLDGGLACPLLSLVLQPLQVVLSGAQVELDKVDLGVGGRSGPGLLLGNILCGVSRQLDGSGLLTGLHPEVAYQLVGFLNGLAGGLVEGLTEAATAGASDRP